MPLHTTPKQWATSLLLCTAFLTACGSQLTEPVKAVKTFYTAPSATASSAAP
jgi:hypothetical protein